MIRCLRLTAVLLLAGSFYGCQSGKAVQRDVDARNMLETMCKLVCIGEAVYDEPPPTSLPRLVDWIATNVSNDLDYIDYDNKTIRDPWNNEVVLVAENETLIGIGSAGPNGRWENGQGDDILVKLQDVR